MQPCNVAPGNTLSTAVCTADSKSAMMVDGLNPKFSFKYWNILAYNS